MKFELKKEVVAFCQNIKRLREMYFLSQEEMANRLRISKGELEKIESGFLPDSVTVEVLFQIQKSFKIPLKDLFKI